MATGVAFSPEGRFLASSGEDDLIKIWDAATGEEQAVLKGHEPHAYGLVFSPDGKTLVSTGGARLWRVGALLDSLAGPPRGRISIERRAH
jgi:WD40 repeat protein